MLVFSGHDLLPTTIHGRRSDKRARGANGFQSALLPIVSMRFFGGTVNVFGVGDQAMLLAFLHDIGDM